MFWGTCTYGIEICGRSPCGPGVLPCCPHKKLEQSHLYSGPSDEIRVTYIRKMDDPPMTSILRLPRLSSRWKQGGRDEVHLPSKGWSAWGVPGAAEGLGLEGKVSLCFSPRSRSLPSPSLAHGWSPMGLDLFILVSLMSFLIKCFLGSGGSYWAVSALCLQHTFLSCDSRQKGQMQKRNEGKTVDERQLFHGTSASFVEAICQQNFDWRVCGLHGTSFGKGKGEGGLQQNPASLHCPGHRKPF